MFTLGRFSRVAGPGLVILIPVLQQMVRTDLRTVVDVVPPQDVITRDNVSVKVNAVIYFRIVDPQHRFGFNRSARKRLHNDQVHARPSVDFNRHPPTAVRLISE